MVHVAGECSVPGWPSLSLIGGATTSKVHTAVRIAPQYDAPTIHVTDASRAVGVAAGVLSERGRDAYIASVNEDYEAVRERFERRADDGGLATVAEARANRLSLDWTGAAPPPAAPAGHAGLRRLSAGRPAGTGSTGRRFSAAGKSPASIRAFSKTRSWGEAARKPVRRCPEDARQDRRGNAGCGRRGRSACSRRTAWATTISRSIRRPGRARPWAPFARCASR